MKKERILYLDFIKALAIYLVCFYHYNNLNVDFLSQSSFSAYLNYLIKGVASTGVPLFLMVNGALMLNKDYKLKNHIIKIINIVLVTFIWGSITLVALAIMSETKYSANEFIISLWNWKGLNHLWFLRSLVCIYILYPLIKEVFDKDDKSILKYTIFTIFILTFGNVLLNIFVSIFNSCTGVNYIKGYEFNFFNDFNIFEGFYGYTLVYFIIGAVVFNKLNTNRIEFNLKQQIYIFLLGIITLFLYGIMMSYLFKEIYDTVWNGYDTVMTLVMCMSIFILAFIGRNKMKKISGIIQLIGANTLGIYFIHWIIGYWLNIYYIRVPFSSTLFMNLLFATVKLGISLNIVLILKKIPLIKLLFKI